MDTKNIKAPVFITIIVALVVILGFLLWKNSAPPEPILGAGQDIKHPFGTGPIKGLGGSQMGAGPSSMQSRRPQSSSGAAPTSP